MKKALIYGLSAALLLASLTACGKSQAEQPNQSEPPTQAATSSPASEPTTTPEPATTTEPTAQTPAAPEQLSSTTQTAPDEAGASQPPEETESQEPAEEVQLFTDVNETVYATGEVNIREIWSPDSARLGSLSKGQSVTRTGVFIQGTETEGWDRVQLPDGTTAYIVSKYLSITKPVQQQTSNGSGTTTTQPTDGGTTDTQPTGNEMTQEQLEQSIADALSGLTTTGPGHVKPGDPGWDDYVSGLAGALNPSN